MDQTLAPVPPPVSAPAPAWALPPQMHHQGQPLSPVKASPNSPARPAAAGVSTSFCTPTQHVESPILVVPQPAKLASSGGEVRLGLLFTGAASEPLGSLSEAAAPKSQGRAKVTDVALPHPGQATRRQCAALRPTSPPATPQPREHHRPTSPRVRPRGQSVALAVCPASAPGLGSCLIRARPAALGDPTLRLGH